MKSCLGILIVFITFVAVVGGAGLVWYLSSTADFPRKDVPGPATGAPKEAVPIPQATPKAREVR